MKSLEDELPTLDNRLRPSSLGRDTGGGGKTAAKVNDFSELPTLEPHRSSINLAIPFTQKKATRYLLRDILAIFFRELRLILALFMIFLSIGLFFASHFEKVYETESRLLVLPGSSSSLTSQYGKDTRILPSEEAALHSEIAIIASIPLAERVVQTIGLQSLYPGHYPVTSTIPPLPWYQHWIEKILPLYQQTSTLLPEEQKRRQEILFTRQAAENFLEQLEVKPVQKSYVLSLTFSHPDPNMAAEALNKLTALYLDYRKELLQPSNTDFLLKQRQQYEQSLEVLEEKIKQFKNQHPILLLSDQENLSLGQNSVVIRQRLEVDIQLKEVETQLQKTQKLLQTLSPWITVSISEQSPSLANGEILKKLQTQRNQLIGQLGTSHASVKKIDRKIAEIQKQGKTAGVKTFKRKERNPLYDQITQEKKSLENRLVLLNTQRDTLKEGWERGIQYLSQINQEREFYEELMFQKKLFQSKLESYHQKAEEYATQEELNARDRNNIRILEQATPPLSGIDYAQIALFIVVIMAKIATLTIILLKNFFRQVMISPEEAHRILKLPVLVTIPVKKGRPAS